MNTLETYQRICTRKKDHDGDHLPYYKADKNEHGNVRIQQPRCVHVDQVPTEEEQVRYRIIFEIIDPRMPSAGWHEVGREHDSFESAKSQYDGIIKLWQEGDDVRLPVIERAVVTWERVEI